MELRVERRLAAILCAGVVGYSRLIERDEAGTLRALRSLRREIVDRLLATHGGRVVPRALGGMRQHAPLTVRGLAEAMDLWTLPIGTAVSPT